MTQATKKPSFVHDPLLEALPQSADDGEIQLAQDVEEMVLRYVLIYGRDEVWDAWNGTSMRVASLRLLYPREWIKSWLFLRRVIPIEHVVFDPSGKHVPSGGINLFRGWPLRPKAGDVGPWLELAGHLLGDHLTYAQRWLACPLQKPGTKMASALVLHGPQGSGKTLLFEALRQIYGPYATTIGQHQIESRFNDWASRKLFAVAEEVIATGEAHHQKNPLKHIITSDELLIEAKNTAIRSEKNQTNLVFLSNEHRPLALEADDRRHAVFWTPGPRTDGLYGRVSQWLNNGGARALMSHLLRLDLGDFHAHTPPPMTDAKRDVQELGLRPSERFTRDWLDHQLDLPMWPCSTSQLYRAFTRWARQQGERSFTSQQVFTSAVAKQAGARLSKSKTAPSQGQHGAPIMLWMPSGTGPLPGLTRHEFAVASVEAFEGPLSRFARADGDLS